MLLLCCAEGVGVGPRASGTTRAVPSCTKTYPGARYACSSLLQTSSSGHVRKDPQTAVGLAPWPRQGLNGARTRVPGGVIYPCIVIIVAFACCCLLFACRLVRFDRDRSPGGKAEKQQPPAVCGVPCRDRQGGPSHTNTHTLTRTHTHTLKLVVE